MCDPSALLVLQSEDVEDLFEKIEDARLQLRHSDARRLFGDEDDAGEKGPVIPMQIFPDLSSISHDHGSKSRGRTEVEKMRPK